MEKLDRKKNPQVEDIMVNTTLTMTKRDIIYAVVGKVFEYSKKR